MTLDLFAGIPVRDRAAAMEWYGRLLGSPPAFCPNDAEAVWEVGEHQYVYVVVRVEGAGHGVLLMFVDDFEERLARAARGGLTPATVETYDNGVRKATFVDPDGNEFGFGGGPAGVTTAG